MILSLVSGAFLIGKPPKIKHLKMVEEISNGTLVLTLAQKLYYDHINSVILQR